MSLFTELKRRSVFRVAIGYFGVSWLIIQVVETVFGIFDYQTNADELVVIFLAIGFVPTMILAWVFELTPEGIKRDVNTDRDTPAMRNFGRQLDRGVIVILSLAVVYFAVDKFLLPVEPPPQQLSGIAVLPFINSSADARQDYLATGMTDQLLNALADIRSLRVIARTSVLSYAGKEVDAKTIADELGVAHILEGSVQVAGERVRVTAALIDAQNEARIWSENFEGALDDIFDIQDAISAAVVARIQVELLGAPLRKADRVDTEAYKLYLRGEQFLENSRGGVEFEEALRLALPLFQQALEIEPGFIEGWLDLAMASLRLSNYLAGEQAAAMIAQYLTCLEKARQLDPDHPVVLAWQASNDFYNGVDTQTIATRYERAIEAAPTSADVMRPARQFVMSIGRVDKALSMAELAVDRDPKCADCWYVLSQILRDIGRHGEAVDAAEIATALGSDLEFSIAKTRLYQHEPDGMLALFDDDYPDYSMGLWGYSLGLYTAGRMAEFEDVFAELRDDWGEVVPLEVAMVYAWSGNLDAAFEWLQRTIELNAYELQLEYRVPFLFNLHGDPRWEEILRKLERHPEQLAKIEFDPEIPAVNR